MNDAGALGRERSRLTREKVLQTALALADRDGIAALRGVRLEILRVLLEERGADPPYNVGLRVAGLRGDPAEQDPRTGRDDVHCDPGRLFEAVADHLVYGVVVG